MLSNKSIKGDSIDFIRFNKYLKSQKFENRNDFFWINNEAFSAENKRKIYSIINSYIPKNNKSFNLTEKSKVINHKNFLKSDSTQSNLKYLVGFFQFWNVIKYYYPHLKSIDKNWDNVLNDNLPSFLTVNNDNNFKMELMSLTTILRDSHVFVKQKNKKDNNLRHPLGFKAIENKIVLFSILNDVVTIKGALLTKINEISVDSAFQTFLKYHSESNSRIAFFNFSRSLPTLLNDSVSLTFNDSIKVSSKKIKDEKINLDDYYKELIISKDISEKIGFINASEIGYFEFGRAIKKLKHKEFIIFDCRGYASLAVLRYGYLLNGKPKSVASYYYPFFKFRLFYLWTG
ncbi:MAG: hypothetical protein IPO04_06730 [Cytophagaceae bacterium]|nr:hypothetical protein [Cytophagaceae bacterium]